jgi:hypothetical protein
VTVSSGLASKPVVTVSLGLSSKPMVEGFPVWVSKPSGLQFISCASKLTNDEDGTGHTSRSSGLLHVEASLALKLAKA